MWARLPRAARDCWAAHPRRLGATEDEARLGLCLWEGQASGGGAGSGGCDTDGCGRVAWPRARGKRVCVCSQELSALAGEGGMQRTASADAHGGAPRPGADDMRSQVNMFSTSASLPPPLLLPVWWGPAPGGTLLWRTPGLRALPCSSLAPLATHMPHWHADALVPGCSDSMSSCTNMVKAAIATQKKVTRMWEMLCCASSCKPLSGAGCSEVCGQTSSWVTLQEPRQRQWRRCSSRRLACAARRPRRRQVVTFCERGRHWAKCGLFASRASDSACIGASSCCIASRPDPGCGACQGLAWLRLVKATFHRLIEACFFALVHFQSCEDSACRLVARRIRLFLLPPRGHAGTDHARRLAAGPHA